MSFVTNFIQQARRQISTSASLNGKRNFRKFLLYGKRGPRNYKAARQVEQKTNHELDIPIDKRGVRDTGVIANGKYKEIQEMIPELIVPDLTGFKLKPYVSFKTPEVIQTEFSSQDLFNAIYTNKIIEDFKNDKLNEDGSSKEPNAEEQLESEEAFIRARKTGSDIF